MLFSRLKSQANTAQSKPYRFSPLSRSHSNGWRPSTTRPLVLAWVPVIAIALIAVLQVLASISEARNGLAFGPVGEGAFTVAQSFAYLYVPIIISVAMSISWTWVDLDMKRMEPYLQMSKPGGASARDSVLLQYPFEFVAVAPFKAFRRRHWSVFVTSVITLLFYWGITPLQGTLLGTKTIFDSQNAVMAQLATTDNLIKQQSTLGSDYLMDLWSMIWFNQSLPAATSRDGTVLPFDTGDPPDTRFSTNVSITVPTSFLYTTLNCTTAVQNKVNVTVWTDGSGCDIDLYGLLANNNQSQQNPILAYGLAKNFATDGFDIGLTLHGRPNCGSKWFGIWKEDVASDIGAVFCQPSYLSRPATVSIDYNGLAFQSVQPTGDAVNLVEKGFNASDYEYLVTFGYPNILDLPYGQLAALNASESSGLDVSGRLGRLNVETVGSSAVTPIAFALGATPNNDVQSLLNQDGFVAAVSRMHNWTFAVAASQMLGPLSFRGEPLVGSTSPNDWSRTESTSLSARCEGPVQALIVNQVQVHVVQALLGLIAVLTLLLIFLNNGRVSNLTSDPSSLAALAALVKPEDSPTVMGSLQDHLLGLPVGATANDLSTARYCLVSGSSGSEINVVSRDTQSGGSESSKEPVMNQSVTADVPFLLGRAFGSIVVMFLTAAIVALAVLKVRSRQEENSLPLPESTAIGQTVILSYLPVVFATLVEQVWVFLNRSLCLLQPFDELRRRKVTAKKSILTRYASLPPQLNVLRAVRSSHFMLALVCLATFSSNLLAISLSDLFRRQDVFLHFNETISPKLSATFRQDAWVNSTVTSGGLHTGGNDIFYLFQPSVPEWKVQLPWTWLGTFYTPYELDQAQIPDTVDNLELETYGFDPLPTCMDIDTLDKSNSGLNFSLTSDGNMTFSLTMPPQTDGMSSCTAGGWQSEGVWTISTDGADANGGVGDGQNDTAKPVALEGIYLLVPSDNRTCEPLMLGMYLRNLTFNTGKDLQYDLNNATSTRSSFFVCSMRLYVDTYSVTADRNGNIDQSEYVSRGSVNDFFGGNASTALPQLLQNMTRVILQEPVDSLHVAWLPHFTVSSMQWVTYLMAAMGPFSTSWDTVDPSTAAPNGTRLALLATQVIETLGSLALSINQDTIFNTVPQSSKQQRRSLLHSRASSMDSNKQVTVEQLVPRVVMDPVKLGLALGLLVFHLFVAILFYTLAPKRILDSLPTTIASQLLFFAGSTLLVSARKRQASALRRSGGGSRSSNDRSMKGPAPIIDGDDNETQQNKHHDDDDGDLNLDSWSDDVKIGYGKFRGTDGVLRTGIERAQLVTALPKSWSGERGGRLRTMKADVKKVKSSDGGGGGATWMRIGGKVRSSRPGSVKDDGVVVTELYDLDRRA